MALGPEQSPMRFDGRTRPRLRGDGGAVMVEFAIVSPFLFALLFGIIEFGWMFGQHLDTRHAAREGSRLVAVDFGTTAQIVSETCDRMDLAKDSKVEVLLKSSPDNSRGDFAIVTVETDPTELTGFFAPITEPIRLSSTVETRLERDANWTENAGGTAC